MPIRLATDCSGMEVPMMALKNLGVSTTHAFACDIDKDAKKTILANSSPQIFYDNLCTRDNNDAPSADLYVAGFPCQPFSAAGLKQGFNDLRGRGKIIFDICDYLEKKRPRAFVLENVGRLKGHDEGKAMEKIVKCLQRIGKGAYKVSWALMNTKEHGVPQNRARVYFVGILAARACRDFEFPEPLPLVSIEQVLEPATKRHSATDLPRMTSTTPRRNVKVALEELRAKGHNPLVEPWVVEIDCTTPRIQYKFGLSPCLTTGRRYGHWITNRGRRMLKSEMLRLQGIDAGNFKQVVSDSVLGKQIGNAMSVNVVERIFVRLLPAAGLVKGKLTDRWEVAAQQGLCAVRPPALKSATDALRAAKVSDAVASRVAARPKTATKIGSTRAKRAAIAAADQKRLGSATQRRSRISREAMLKVLKGCPPKQSSKETCGPPTKKRRVVYMA
jgi:DNA (cytosine-5)-methyltransferase 1